MEETRKNLPYNSTLDLSPETHPHLRVSYWLAVRLMRLLESHPALVPLGGLGRLGPVLAANGFDTLAKLSATPSRPTRRPGGGGGGGSGG